jgi:prenyltransferase beta subunit
MRCWIIQPISTKQTTTSNLDYKLTRIDQVTTLRWKAHSFWMGFSYHTHTHHGYRKISSWSVCKNERYSGCIYAASQLSKWLSVNRSSLLFIFMFIFQINVFAPSQIVTGLVTEISRHVETVVTLLLVQKALFT